MRMLGGVFKSGKRQLSLMSPNLIYLGLMGNNTVEEGLGKSTWTGMWQR